MLISPPFLPERQANETENAWLDRAMLEVEDGSFPVGNNLCWHGGIHLQAPDDAGGQPLPVRAIADGVVRFARNATPHSSDSEHILAYDNGWTSDGVVVIEHNTEIGAAADNTPVNVRFYSIYNHLTDIPDSVIAGARIYRKEIVGQAGYIAGIANRIHFETVCDEENLHHLIGRQNGDVPITQNGRDNVVFGEIYIHLPAGVPYYNPPNGRRLFHANTTAHTVAAGNSPGAPQLLEQAGTTPVDCYIGLRYAQGDGAQANRGDLTITTYREDGSICGQRQIDEGEYNLYYRRSSHDKGLCKNILKDYANQPKPVPSALYELLRFGRLVNTGHQTLAPANTSHWREIVLPSADSSNGTQTAWVNLNNQGDTPVHVFSDADFPHWRGWKICSDDTSPDSRCDAAAIRELLDIDGDSTVTVAERQTQLGNTETRKKLRKVICAMPSEWDAANITDPHWGWLKGNTEENPDPFTNEDFQKFTAYLQALSFAGGAALAARYRFHPRGFIEAFRQCLWFSAEELAQIVPRTSIDGGGHVATVTWQNAFARVQAHYIYLNRLIQKYHGSSRRRAAYVLAQSILETGYFRTIKEDGLGHNKLYDAFYGRGYHQLTWAGTYASYGEYRNLPNLQTPASYTDTRITATSVHRRASSEPLNFRWSPRYDPEILTSSLNEAMESSGYYWLTKDFRGTANLNRACDQPLTPAVVGFISWCVNGGGYGYAGRQQYTQFAANILMDEPLLSGSVVLQYPPFSNSNGVTSFPPQVAPASYTSSLTINYAPQRQNT
jgi:hydroxyethylthiazole kinase